MFSISDISLGSSAKKRYTRSLSHDNNTTMPFGFVQPLLSQRLEASSDIVVSTRQLVRLAPLPVPTFGRMKMVNKAVFVPIAEMCPFYEALLSKQSFAGSLQSYIPTTLPYTSNASLQYYLLANSNYSIYQIKKLSDDTSELTGLTKLPADFASSFAESSLSGNLAILPYLDNNLFVASTVVNGKPTGVSIDGADYIVEVQDITLINTKYIVAFHYTREMRNLRSIFVGLGYSLDLFDQTHVSFIPLLSYYKAWFDCYAPQRTISWVNTAAYALIQAIADRYVVNFTGFMTLTAHDEEMFNKFFSALKDCYYVSQDDFVSVHRAKPILEGRTTKFIDNFGDNKAYNMSDGANSNAPSNLTLAMLQTIQKLSRYVSKDSVIGKKMTDWVRVHFNADIANSLYKNSYFVGSWSIPLAVDDIFSSSDTAVESSDGSQTGELLGAYAGKGIGFGDSGHFKFHAPVAGYLFVLSCIIPESGYFQGTSADLYCIDLDTIPQPEFDALGYELNPNGMFYDSNGIMSTDAFRNVFDPHKGFGFVPRYSSLKVKRNTVNGDMSRRGTIDSLSAYYLDRYITRSNIVVNSKSTANNVVKYNATQRTASVPSASEAWRYLCKYDWLGNFNRIFYNSGSWTNLPTTGVGYSYNVIGTEDIDDNFIVQTVFDVKVTDWMKPLSQSWDTFEESTDTSTVDVSAE
ncbi:hypothetical protein [Microvirus sp.]|nr:hypothetical protein [Microvirus sp.]